MKDTVKQKFEKVLAQKARADEVREVWSYLQTEQGITEMEAHMDNYLQSQEAFTDTEMQDREYPSTARMWRRIQNATLRRVGFCQKHRAWLRTAAVVLILLALAPFIYQAYWHTGWFNSNPLLTVTVPEKEQMQILFQDGTKVFLNSGSTLKYPARFSLSKREVFLEGEAYFLVEKLRRSPFYVHLNQADVKVTGTTFNVKDYPEDKEIRVYLEKGSISFLLNNREPYSVTPGELLVYNKLKQTVDIQVKENNRLQTKWRDKILYFDNTPLNEMLNTLRYRFDCDFVIQDASVLSYRYTIVFDDENLNTILQDLEKIAPVTFSNRDGIIYVTKR